MSKFSRGQTDKEKYDKLSEKELMQGINTMTEFYEDSFTLLAGKPLYEAPLVKDIVSMMIEYEKDMFIPIYIKRAGLHNKDSLKYPLSIKEMPKELSGIPELAEICVESSKVRVWPMPDKDYECIVYYHGSPEIIERYNNRK